MDKSMREHFWNKQILTFNSIYLFNCLMYNADHLEQVQLKSDNHEYQAFHNEVNIT